MNQKDDTNTAMGVVTEALPNTLFRVDMGNNTTIITYLSGKMRMNRIKVLVGDRVEVLIDKYGGKGRIIKRGFTLIELLVVISIISLLASIVLASVNSAREKGRVNSARYFASQVDRAAGDRAIGEWNFDEGTGTTTRDAFGSGNTGTLMYGPLWSTDTPSGTGYSILLDEINDYIAIPDNSDLKYVGGGLTVALWIKPDANETTGGPILSKPWNGGGGYNYRITYNASGTISFDISGATAYGITTTATVPKSKWSFITATVDSSNKVNLYIDGVLKASGTHSIASWVPGGGDSNTSLVIGTIFPYGSGGNIASYYFNGLVDDPRIFAKSLVARNVENLFAEGFTSHLATHR